MLSPGMTPILHCNNPDCPKDWETLPQGGETDIRVCVECLKAVFRCETEDDVQRREEAGQRAALRGS